MHIPWQAWHFLTCAENWRKPRTKHRFEVANFQVLRKTRRKTSILKLQSVKIGGSLVRNARFGAPTCLVSRLWFSRGLAVSAGEAAKPVLLSCCQLWKLPEVSYEMIVLVLPRVSSRVSGFPVASPCLWGKPQDLSFSKVSKEVVMSFCVAGVALCDIPTCLIMCQKCQNWRKSRTKCWFFCIHVSCLESLVLLWRRRVYGESCKTSLFEGFQAGCHVVLRGRRGTLWHSNLFDNMWKISKLARLVSSLWFPVASPCLWGKLRTPHSTLYTPHSTIYTLDPTLYTLHSTLYTLHFTLLIPHLKLYTPQSTLYTTLYTLHFPLLTPHSTLYTPHSTLYTLHSTLYTLHSTLYTTHSLLYTPHFLLHTPHFIHLVVEVNAFQWNVRPRWGRNFWKSVRCCVQLVFSMFVFSPIDGFWAEKQEICERKLLPASELAHFDPLWPSVCQ